MRVEHYPKSIRIGWMKFLPDNGRNEIIILPIIILNVHLVGTLTYSQTFISNVLSVTKSPIN